MTITTLARLMLVLQAGSAPTRPRAMTETSVHWIFVLTMGLAHTNSCATTETCALQTLATVPQDSAAIRSNVQIPCAKLAPVT